jgi:hypothetical protein
MQQNLEADETLPDEDRYGDFPRSLRTPMSLPALAVPPVSLDEGITVMETR